MVCVDSMNKMRKEESDMEDSIYSKIGKVHNSFGIFQLKSVLIKNDAGDWGTEPNENAVGIIRSTNFNNNGKLDLSDIAYRTLSPQKLEDKRLSSSDILIERSGGSDTQPVGRVGYITDDMTNKNLAFANFIQRISLDETVDAKFVYYCLQQMYEMGITASMQFQTTGIRNLDWKFYLKSNLPKPAKEEQTAIANILSKVDEAIESFQNSITATERLKKSLMQNLLTGRMKPDGTFRTSEEFYINEKFSKVPIGWEVKRVDALFDFYPTASYSRSMLSDNGDCKYIHYGDIHTRFDTFLDISKETLPYINKDMVKKFVYLENGDIIISDTSEDYEGVGKLVETVNLGNSKVISGLHTLLLRPKKNELINGFKGYLFNEERVRLEFLKYVTGIKVYSISKNSLAKVLLPIPTRQEQESIKDRLDTVNNDISSSRTKIMSLERLKKSLMQNLLTGKVIIDN